METKTMKSLVDTVKNMYAPKPAETSVGEATMMKDTGEVVHNCAKHVEHAAWGKGATLAEEHADPDRNGHIAWYDIMFEHGLEKGVPTTELKILAAENHGHPTKKAKKMAEALGGDNSRNTENDRIKEKTLQAVKDASAQTANTQATPGQVNGAKVGGEKELIHQGVREEVEVDETIIYKTIGYDIQEADKNYDAHFKAHMKKAGIKHPGELKTDADKKAFFNKVDAGFKAKNEDVFLEALLSADVADRIKSHEAAGHKVSDKANRMKDGEQEYSFVVTQPSGKRSRHIYHGSKVKHETMSPAPKSKEASEIGDDEDDK
jgi:hypothetical protein